MNTSKLQTLSVKIGGYPDPTEDQLQEVMTKLNNYLPDRYDLRNGRVKGKYVYYDINMDDYDDPIYYEGLIAGILMGIGVEII